MATASRPAAPATGFILFLLLALLFSSLQEAQGGIKLEEEEDRYVPVRRVVYRHLRRSSSSSTAALLPAEDEEATSYSSSPTYYEPFEVCDRCRCCAAESNASASACVDTSCCYAIDCDIPGKPFGVCAFTPRTCGCGGAGADNCTRPS